MKKSLLAILVLLPFGFINSQNSVMVGSMSNSYSMLRPEQNQAWVNSTLNAMGMIHRNNTTLNGGSSGNLRFCISTDGGTSWNTELGNLNSTLTFPGRYPNMTLYNPSGNTTLSSAFLVWGAPTIGATWNGHVNGTAPVVTSNPVASTENYQFTNQSAYLPGGLCESVSGTFWMTEIKYDTAAATFTDSIYLYKGIFNTGTSNVDWTRSNVLYAPNSTTFDGARHIAGTNMAFSPDGQTGYVMFLGDINGADSTYNPVYYKSTDAGTSWSAPTELIINNIPGLGDTITQYLFDTGTDIIYVSEVATSFDADITVDAGGNLHIFTNVMAVEMRDTNDVVTNPKQYSVYSGMPKYVCDIYTTDGGTTWTSLYVSQVNSLRTTATGITVDNFNQISRTADGTHVFYSWTDTDTLIYTGITSNDFPNVRVAGFRPSDGYRTCWKRIEGVANEDFVITPTMAPMVLEQAGPTYTLPIFSQEMLVDDLSPVNIHYMGKTAVFCDEDFMPANSFDLSFSFTSQCYSYTSCFALGNEEEETINFNIYPNPTSSNLNIQTDGENIVSIMIVNNMGQVVRTITNNLPGNGNNTVNLDVTSLPSGMYTVNLVTKSKTYSKKFTVVK